MEKEERQRKRKGAETYGERAQYFHHLVRERLINGAQLAWSVAADLDAEGCIFAALE